MTSLQSVSLKTEEGIFLDIPVVVLGEHFGWKFFKSGEEVVERVMQFVDGTS